MSFNQYLRESLDELKFQAWLKQAQQDFRPISIEDAETLLDTQEGVDEYIYNNFKDSDAGPVILMKLINGEEV